MIPIILYTLYSVAGIFSLWVFYLAVMALKRCRDTGQLTGFVVYPAYVVLAIGLLIDALVNWTICTILFLDWPQETLVTSRLKRLINDEGWRSDLAAWFCMNLLNRFDPSGNHCR